MTGAEILTRFTADTSQVDKATSNYSVGLGKLTTAFTLANVAAQAISKTIGIISQNMDNAISRFDTMNNFPKVMSNLGISADESSEVINDLGEKLKGLPTALDKAALSVQRLTTKTGDVKEAEKIFLALNNAILAGGASSEIQSTAMEQLSQAFAKGKPDMMEWRSMMTAMPAQLKQVATAMGYVSVEALGEAVRSKDGAEIFSKMMDTMVVMNEKGVEGFKSFEEQARNATGGVKTNITNMKTAITRGITNIIKSVDKSLESFGGLGGVISSVGKIAEEMFTGLGNTLSTVIPILLDIGETVIPLIKDAFTQISPLIQQFVQSIMPIMLNILKQIVPIIMQIMTSILPVIIKLINTLLPPILQIIEMILPTLKQLLDAILPLLHPIISLIQPIIDLLMAIITPLVEIINMILPPLISLFTTLIETVIPPLAKWFEFLGNIIKDSVQGAFTFIKPIVEGMKNVLGGITTFISGVFSGNWRKAWEGIKSTFSSIVEALPNIIKAPINYVIKLLNKFIRGINKIQIPDWVPGVGGKGLHIPEIPQLNVGTNFVPEDTLAMVHKGEAVIPKKFNPYANGIKSQTLGSMMASTPTINVQVINNMEVDPLGQMVQNIKTFSGGAKNDYNYGMGR